MKFSLIILNFFISLKNRFSSMQKGLDNIQVNSNSLYKMSKEENVNSLKFDFSLKNFKSLFFNEQIKEDFIFEDLENKYSSNKKSKKGLFNFSLFNKFNSNSKSNSKLKETSSFNSIVLLNSNENYQKDLFKEFLNNKLFFNLKSLSKFGIYFILVLVLVIVLVSYFISLEGGLIILIAISLVFLTIIFLPKMKKRNQLLGFSRELPYALRQLATELKSGKSLFNSLESVVEADYGSLSFEFSRVLEEIKYGETSEDAFIHLENRVKSEALSRVVREILSTLRIGGNLAYSLSLIAEDINFEMRMKLKDYAQKLNAFIMIYTFIAILAPVVLLTLLLAASTVMGDIVPADFLLILYGIFFPMLIIFLAIMVKKLEPKI